MIKLAPSILASDFSVLGEQIKILEKAGAHYVHIDVMDGNFVPNISMGAPIIKSIRKITNMVFDVHLMIDKPERYLEDFANSGADIINFHVEASDNIKSSLEKVRSLNKKTALTIKPDTDLKEIYNNIENLDLVLIMSVEPGFGGQSIIPSTLRKAEELANYIQKHNIKTEIEMDGGIYISNVKSVLDAGVNVVVAGSAVFNAPNIELAVKDFYNIFEEFSK